MPKKSEISYNDRVRIQVLSEEGKSLAEIADLVGCTRCAVQCAIRRFVMTKSHNNKSKSGRKRVTSKREDRILILESLKDLKKSSSALSDEFSKAVITRTARRRLLEAGLKGCKAQKNPWLSEKNRKNRLEWARRYQHFTEEDWSNVLWSDESNFEIFGELGVPFVRRRIGEEYHTDCVQTVKHGGGSIMIWSCAAADGVGEMFICERRIDS